MVEWQTVLRFLASPSDPSGLARAETFWNSRSHGLRPWCFGQFQLSYSAESRWVPRSFSEIRSGPAATHPEEKTLAVYLWRRNVASSPDPKIISRYQTKMPRVVWRTGRPTARNGRAPLGDGWSEHGGAVRRERTRALDSVKGEEIVI
jgi:hypothetical protein